MLIGFTGYGGSGKTDATKYLMQKYGGGILSFADGIKYIDKYLFGNGKKNRERLQQIGEFFRGIDFDIWVNRIKETIEYELYSYNIGNIETGNLYIDDLRRINEYKMLIEEGFKVYRIISDEDIRVKRLTERDGSCDISLLYNESEIGCDGLDLIEIENNGTLEEFHERIDQIIEEK